MGPIHQALAFAVKASSRKIAASQAPHKANPFAEGGAQNFSSDAGTPPAQQYIYDPNDSGYGGHQFDDANGSMKPWPDGRPRRNSYHSEGFYRNSTSPQPPYAASPPPPYPQQDHAGQLGKQQFKSVPMRTPPVVIPQVGWGQTAPFIRAYSAPALEPFGISQRQFLAILDAFNLAMKPNAAIEGVQKIGSIAGFFVPGAASLAMMGSQIVLGVGSAVHMTTAAITVIIQANQAIFWPKGLEAVIVPEDHFGEISNSSGTGMGWQPGGGYPGGGHSGGGYGGGGYAGGGFQQMENEPLDRLRNSGGQFAPLTTILASDYSPGMQASKDMAKAQKKIAKGKIDKAAKYKSGSKWLVIRSRQPPQQQ